MQLIDTYPLPPGQCKVCGGTKVPVIDTIRDIDSMGWEGRLYVCAECAGAFADLLGWASPEKVGELRAAHEAVCAERDEWRERAETAERALEGVVTFRANRRKAVKAS